MTTETQTTQPTLIDRHRVTWAAGDYAEVAERLVMPMGPVVVEATAIHAGDEVLDVATGSGNAAIPVPSNRAETWSGSPHFGGGDTPAGGAGMYGDSVAKNRPM